MGGVTGFGYSFVATPLLLLIGFPLPFVVTANMTVAGHHADLGRVPLPRVRHTRRAPPA